MKTMFKSLDLWDIIETSFEDEAEDEEVDQRVKDL